MRAPALVLAGLLGAAPAFAQPAVPIRTGEHPGHGRIVFDWPAAPPYRVEQEGERVRLRFGAAAAMELPRRLPRNMRAIAREGEVVEITIAPGARIRHFRNGAKVALDVLDPAGEAPPAPARAAAPPRPAREAASGAAPPAARPLVAAPSADAPPGRGAAPIAAAVPSAPEEAASARTGAAPPARGAETALRQGDGAAREAAPRADMPPATGAAGAAREGQAQPAADGSANAGAAVRARDAAATRHAVSPAASSGIAASAAEPAAAAPRGAPSRESATPARAEAPSAEPAAMPRAVAPRPAIATPAAPAETDALRLLPGSPAAAPSLRLPRAGEAGIALFTRGDRLVMVVEGERPFDLARLAGHPHWPVAEARRLAGGAALILPMPPGLLPAVSRQGGDLLVSFRPALDPAEPARLVLEEGRARIAARAPGAVLALNDPLTELPLLVGTHRDGGQRQPLARALPEFDLLPSFAGAVLLARSDRLTLRAGADRFTAALEGGSLATAAAVPERLADGAAMTRFLDLPAQPVPALLERLRADQAQVAQTPPLSRAAPRLQAAQTLLALGLPQEAAAMLRLAASETPEAAAQGLHRALSGIVALLAGEAGEGLEAPLPATDELAFWRALRTARAGDPRAAAPALAATLPLLLSYPDGLRRRLLPPVAEALAEGGQGPAARRAIEAGGEEQPMPMAQALLELAEGQVDRALEALEAAANGRDRRVRARALRRAAELRFAEGRQDAAATARALEAALFSWRGDEEELALRRRIAQLRQEGGDPRGAIAMLREAESAFPEATAALRPLVQGAFLQALRSEPPLQAVALHDSQPELVPANAEGEAALAHLADRLVALDLPERGGALLRRAMERMAPGEARAALGLRLAALRLGERDPAGALEALSASGAPGLPPALVAERALAAARAEARRGNRALALEALAALGPAGDEATAEIQTEARDFAAAAVALGRHLATLTPAAGPLPEPAQRVALRQAALLALAGDERGIAALRASHGGRFAAGPLAQGFEALTADPVRGLADLPRMARELNLFRGLGQWREPLRTAALPAG